MRLSQSDHLERFMQHREFVAIVACLHSILVIKNTQAVWLAYLPKLARQGCQAYESNYRTSA